MYYIYIYIYTYIIFIYIHNTYYTYIYIYIYTHIILCIFRYIHMYACWSSRRAPRGRGSSTGPASPSMRSNMIVICEYNNNMVII